MIFGLSNRAPVEIGFFPFGALDFPWLGLFILLVFAAGFVFGLMFHLPPRLAAHRRARRAERRAAELETKIADMKIADMAE